MSDYSAFAEELANHRAKDAVKAEKAMWGRIRAKYRERSAAIDLLTLSFFSKYARDNVLYQEDINGKRINRLQNDISKELSKVSAWELKEFNKRLTSTAKDEYLFFAFAYSQMQPDQKPKKLTKAALAKIMADRWAGEHFTKSLSRKKQEIAYNLRVDILRTTASGASLSEIKQQTNRRMKQTMEHSLLVYQNEETRKRDQAEYLLAENFGVKKEQFVASLDDRSCEICGEYDGKIYDVGRGPAIPLHVRCRCRYIAVIEGWQQTDRKARDIRSQTSYVTSAKNYKEWIAEQGADWGYNLG